MKVIHNEVLLLEKEKPSFDEDDHDIKILVTTGGHVSISVEHNMVVL